MKCQIPITQWRNAEFACPLSFLPSSRVTEPLRPRLPRIRRVNDRPLRPMLTQEISAALSCF